MDRAGFWQVLHRLRDAGLAEPSGLLVLAHTEPVRKLASWPEDKIDFVLTHPQHAREFLEQMRSEAHQTWRLLTIGVIGYDWPDWLARFWSPVVPVDELRAVVRGFHQLPQERRIGIRSRDFPLLFAAGHTYLQARNHAVHGEDHIVAHRQFCRDAATVAVRTAREETLMTERELAAVEQPLRRLHRSVWDDEPLLDHEQHRTQGVGWWHGGN